MWWSKEEVAFQKSMGTFHSRNESCRFFGSSASDGTLRLFTKFASHGRYIIGGGVCTSACLLWYMKKRSQVVRAKTLMNEDTDESYISVDEKWRKLENAISESRILLQRVKDEYGCPGVVAAVSVNGHHVWSNAMGLADIENQLAMTPAHVIRIASISKVLTVTALAKLWQENKLDIDKPVQEFVPSFPIKTWNNEKVTITTRHLLSHLSGIRHYRKVTGNEDDSTANNDKDTAGRSTTDSSSLGSDGRNGKSSTDVQEGRVQIKDSECTSVDKISVKDNEEIGDAKYLEMFSTKKYKDILESLEQFEDDPLVHKPGTKFLYSTHAWSLVSAVMESAGGKPYLTLMKELFDELGLHHTQPDKHAPLIPNRSRLYTRNRKTKKLENAPYVDVSSKWAGGGFLSTVGDLVKFADTMLYSYQCSSSCKGVLPGYLNRDIIHQMWLPVDIAKHPRQEGAYGMGWNIIHKPQKYGKCRPSKFFVSHSGGAIGASSILLISADDDSERSLDENHQPRGISVAIIVNVDGVSLQKTAEKIAILFSDAR